MIRARLADALHRSVARSPRLTAAYLSLAGAFLKRFGSEPLRRAFMRSVNRVRWPEVEFPVQTVLVGSRTRIRLVPKLYFGASDALIAPEFPEDREVFQYFESGKFDYDAVIDVGAYIGLHTVFFATRARESGMADCRIFAFEPWQAGYERLLTNIAVNSVRGVTTFNCVLGAATDFAGLYRPVMLNAAATLSRDHAASFGLPVEVERVLVADAVMVEKLTAASRRVLMKLKAEGAAETLDRLKGWVLQKRPTILLEVLERYAEKLEALTFLTEAGYRKFRLTPSGPVAADRLEPHVDFRTYLLTPPARPA